MAIRVLHCLTATAGHAQGLARAERAVGLASWAVALRPDRHGFGADEVLGRAGSPLRCEMMRWALLWRALRRFDIVHFNFGASLFPVRVPGRHAGTSAARWLPARAGAAYRRALELRDLPWLRLAGTRIAVTYQGSDARQADYCRAHFAVSPAGPAGEDSTESDASKRARIARFARYADRIYALNPDLLHVLPERAEFLPYAHVDPREWRPADSPDPLPDRPVLVHAPSDRAVKGTHLLLDAVARLRHEGIRLDLVLVEGRPRDEVRRACERGHLVVDQLLCGWYGGFALEAMALGRPVVCYIRPEDLRFVPPAMRQALPIIPATPMTLTDVLRTWLTTRKGDLAEAGRRSRAYVEQWHDPLRIATRLRHDYAALLGSGRPPGDH